AARIRRRARKLPTVEHRLYECVVESSSEAGDIPDVVDGEDVSLIEIRRSVVVRLVRTAVEDVGRVVVCVIKSLRVRVRYAVLEAVSVTPVHLNLQSVVIRRARVHHFCDRRISLIRSQEIIRKRARLIWSVGSYG